MRILKFLKLKMKQTPQQNDYTITGLFPIPIYRVYRDSILDSTEEKEIANIIKDGKTTNEEPSSNNSFSNNKYIFKTKLTNLKEFCEKHIKIYVKEVLRIENEELNFYITQSWLGITMPGEIHDFHFHPNSIISGVFYISTEESDQISFIDPAGRMKNLLFLHRPIEYSIWNSDSWSFNANTNELFLFPAWLDHSVKENSKATKDRISIAFNVFVKGIIGDREYLNELIL
jgi:uncharacterized protein (TIGR02466 family)